MSYTIDLSNGLVMLPGDTRHHAVSGRVVVAMDTDSRWAELTCVCGTTAVARWGSGTSTYRELLQDAWDSSCGSIVRRAV